MAETIHANVAALAVPHAGLGAGAVSVSIGAVCSTEVRLDGTADPVRLADEALYAAKAGGRNRTECAPARPRRLRLVGRQGGSVDRGRGPAQAGVRPQAGNGSGRPA